jgi:hypothetical protein
LFVLLEVSVAFYLFCLLFLLFGGLRFVGHGRLSKVHIIFAGVDGVFGLVIVLEEGNFLFGYISLRWSDDNVRDIGVGGCLLVDERLIVAEEVGLPLMCFLFVAVLVSDIEI